MGDRKTNIPHPLPQFTGELDEGLQALMAEARVANMVGVIPAAGRVITEAYRQGLVDGMEQAAEILKARISANGGLLVLGAAAEGGPTDASTPTPQEPPGGGPGGSPLRPAEGSVEEPAAAEARQAPEKGEP